MDIRAESSGAWLNRIYYIRINRNNKPFFCCECGKEKRTVSIFYPEGESNYLVCSDCYAKMISDSEKYKQKNSCDLPIGSTIYLGTKKHKCDSPNLTDKIFRILAGSGDFKLVHLYKCNTCGDVFLKGGKYDQRTYYNYKITKSKFKDTIRWVSSGDHTSQKKRRRIIRINDFLTRTVIKKCINEKHKIQDIQCSIRVMHNDYSVSTEMVPAFYCKTCNKYYLLESDYQNLNNMGIILCNVVEQKYWGASGDKEFNVINDESLLHKLGYNVGSNSCLSQWERHKILKCIMDEGKMTRLEIISHLDYLIRRSQNRKDFSEAVDKWKSDRDFVSNYTLDRAKPYEARKILHRSYEG